jgi:hypothetical protein
MGLGNQAQAFLLGLSAFLIVLGGASASIPDFMPPDIKYTVAIICWFLGIIGFALKEALGSAFKEPATS